MQRKLHDFETVVLETADRIAVDEYEAKGYDALPEDVQDLVWVAAEQRVAENQAADAEGLAEMRADWRRDQ